jgi:Bacterial SCP ortholog
MRAGPGRTKFDAMPARRSDPARLLAAVNAQRAALGDGEWSGRMTAEALGAGCVSAAGAAIDAGLPPEPEALRCAVRHLLGLLAARAPGRAVEVRIPPYAAIQCVAGPRHTRGTPPNVVETDAVTWIRLATGRISWAGALSGGLLSVSGPRADLSALLPLAAAS